jgi:hypothetical protein
MGLVAPAAANASAIDDCNQSQDLDRNIRECSLIIESHAKGNKSFACNNRGNSFKAKGEYDRAIADLLLMLISTVAMPIT